MIDCCVEQLKEVHEVADYTWWFQRFVLASPFVLLIPDFDPTAGTSDLLQTGVQKAGEMAFSTASAMVIKNQNMPDFVDTVKNLGKIAVGKQMQLCQYHMLRHTGREPEIAAFWNKLGETYKHAFFG
jgi:hypothetical protein